MSIIDIIAKISSYGKGWYWYWKYQATANLIEDLEGGKVAELSIEDVRFESIPTKAHWIESENWNADIRAQWNSFEKNGFNAKDRWWSK